MAKPYDQIPERRAIIRRRASVFEPIAAIAAQDGGGIDRLDPLDRVDDPPPPDPAVEGEGLAALGIDAIRAKMKGLVVEVGYDEPRKPRGARKDASDTDKD